MSICGSAAWAHRGAKVGRPITTGHPTLTDIGHTQAQRLDVVVLVEPVLLLTLETLRLLIAHAVALTALTTLALARTAVLRLPPTLTLLPSRRATRLPSRLAPGLPALLGLLLRLVLELVLHTHVGSLPYWVGEEPLSGASTRFTRADTERISISYGA